ncbi:MAG: hypothetical protein ACPL7O_12375, partial [Armatimonadota bacterium]
MKRLIVFWVVLVIAVPFFWSCGLSLEVLTVSIGDKDFNFNIPPLVKLDQIKTIAVLMPITERPVQLQAILQQEIKRRLPSVRMIDSRRISDIVFERGLQKESSALEKFGDLLEIDLFVATDSYMPGRACVRLIGRDGRVLTAKVVPSPSVASVESIATAVAEEIAGRVEQSNFHVWFAVPKGGGDPCAIERAYRQGRYEECESIFNNEVQASTSDAARVNGHLNLYRLYHSIGETDKARASLASARAVLGATTNWRLRLQADQLGKYIGRAERSLSDLEDLSKLSKRQPVDPQRLAVAKTTPAILPFQEGGTVTSRGYAVALYLTIQLSESERVAIFERRHFSQLLQHKEGVASPG